MATNTNTSISKQERIENLQKQYEIPHHNFEQYPQEIQIQIISAAYTYRIDAKTGEERYRCICGCQSKYHIDKRGTNNISKCPLIRNVNPLDERLIRYVKTGSVESHAKPISRKRGGSCAEHQKTISDMQGQINNLKQENEKLKQNLQNYERELKFRPKQDDMDMLTSMLTEKETLFNNMNNQYQTNIKQYEDTISELRKEIIEWKKKFETLEQKQEGQFGFMDQSQDPDVEFIYPKLPQKSQNKQSFSNRRKSKSLSNYETQLATIRSNYATQKELRNAKLVDLRSLKVKYPELFKNVSMQVGGPHGRSINDVREDMISIIFPQQY
jgi:hypothetical protein